MKEILRTTIRLYAEKPADREALRLLRQVREEQHLRYADAIVAAVNAHYGQARQGASIISSGRKSAALSAKRWQHHPRLCSTCFDVLGKHRQRHRRTRTRRTRPISTICWI